MTIYNYTAPNWEPLQRAIALANLPEATICDFMWMCEQPAGNHQYKNCDTRHYVHLRGNESADKCLDGLASAMAITYQIKRSAL